MAICYIVRVTAILAIANERGGVGRTTLAAHIAGIAALHGGRVLALDADPRGDLAGKPASDRPGEPLGWRLSTRDRLEVCSAPHPARTLDLLSKEVDGHDLVVIDTPGGGTTLDRSLAVADGLVIPVGPDDRSLDGAERLAHRVGRLRARGTRVPELIGFCLFGFPTDGELPAIVRSEIEEDTERQDAVLTTVIPDDPAGAWALWRSGILAHESDDPGMVVLGTSYQLLAGEIAERLTQAGM
jgi:chromosome partitioning protein